MKKVYFIIPLVMLILFACYYVVFKTQDDERKRVENAERQKESDRIKKEQDEYHRKVMEEARYAAEKKAKDEKERKEKVKAQEEARKKLRDDRDNALVDREKKAKTLSNLREELYNETNLNEKAEEKLVRLKEEKEFLEHYLPLAEDNVKHLQDFLEQVSKWEDAQSKLPAKK